FSNQVVGGNIPHSFIPACERGFEDALEKGSLIGHRVTGVRMILEDGLAHSVDSNEMSFRLAAAGAFREAYKQAKPIVLEPIMAVSITAPVEFQGTVLSSVNKRKGTILDTEVHEDYFHASVEAPLNNMFGYSTDLRSSTQGKGEFSME
ncbi:ribosomal protein S5 domain 2-type protein, partial [Piptocephalis cylindrospora]